MTRLRITTETAAVNVALVHRFLSESSTWGRGIPLPVVQRAIDNSLCFSGFLGKDQIAFARVISDYATFANLVDVFVLPEHRGQGHGKSLMKAVMASDALQGLRRFTLATGDAHGLYEQFGFTSPLKPHSLMERYFPGLYTNSQ